MIPRIHSFTFASAGKSGRTRGSRRARVPSSSKQTADVVNKPHNQQHFLPVNRVWSWPLYVGQAGLKAFDSLLCIQHLQSKLTAFRTRKWRVCIFRHQMKGMKFKNGPGVNEMNLISVFITTTKKQPPKGGGIRRPFVWLWIGDDFDVAADECTTVYWLTAFIRFFRFSRESCRRMNDRLNASVDGIDKSCSIESKKASPPVRNAVVHEPWCRCCILCSLPLSLASLPLSPVHFVDDYSKTFSPRTTARRLISVLYLLYTVELRSHSSSGNRHGIDHYCL